MVPTHTLDPHFSEGARVRVLQPHAKYRNRIGRVQSQFGSFYWVLLGRTSKYPQELRQFRCTTLSPI